MDLKVCQSEHLTDESREVRGPFDSAQGDHNPSQLRKLASFPFCMFTEDFQFSLTIGLPSSPLTTFDISKTQDWRHLPKVHQPPPTNITRQQGQQRQPFQLPNFPLPNLPTPYNISLTINSTFSISLRTVDAE